MFLISSVVWNLAAFPVKTQRSVSVQIILVVNVVTLLEKHLQLVSSSGFSGLGLVVVAPNGYIKGSAAMPQSLRYSIRKFTKQVLVICTPTRENTGISLYHTEKYTHLFFFAVNNGQVCTSFHTVTATVFPGFLDSRNVIKTVMKIHPSLLEIVICYG